MHEVPASIPADCSQDVSSALNAWLDSLPASNAEVRFPRAGCFLTETTIGVTRKTSWAVHGRGTVLKRTRSTPPELRYPRNNRHFAVVDSADVEVSGLRVVGLNQQSDVPGQPQLGSYVRDLEFEHGFSAWGSRRVIFRDVTSNGTFGDGIYLHSDVEDVTIGQVDIARNGRQGIGVLADRVLIDGAVIHGSRRAGVDLEPDSTPMHDVEVRNSTISSHLLAFAAGGPGDVDRVHLHHNTVRQSGVPFIYAARVGHTRNDWTITDNWVQRGLGSPLAAIKLENAARAKVERNVVPVSPHQARKIFQVLDGSEVHADCNVFTNALSDPVVDVDGSSDVRITNMSTTLVPPPCLDVTRVGAPRPAEPRRTSHDYFSAATVVPSLAPGESSSVYPVDNTGFTREEFEDGTFGTTGRSAWFRYRTGSSAEAVVVRTTGALRSLRVTTGDHGLFWQVQVGQHHDAGELVVQLQPGTTYSIQADDSTYYRGPAAPRSLQILRK